MTTSIQIFRRLPSTYLFIVTINDKQIFNDFGELGEDKILAFNEPGPDSKLFDVLQNSLLMALEQTQTFFPPIPKDR